LQQLYSLLVTPFVTGFVGYFTNYLAIKMLFRPHRKRWYSLGWQGVIPKKRGKLAKEVGIMVGKELLGEKEISNALSSDNFQLLLNKAVSTELKKFLSADYGSVYDIAYKTGIPIEKILMDSLNNLLSDDEFVDKINFFLNNELKNLANDFLSKSIGDFKDFDKYIKKFVNQVLQNGNWQDIIIDEISSFLSNLVLSGKSINDLLPNSFETKIERISDLLSDKIIDFFENMLKEESTKKKIAKKLIDIKDNLFDNGLFDSIKVGFISMFLTEEVISGIVEKELPAIIKYIKENEEVRKKIKSGISIQINNFINKPLYSFAGVIGADTLFEIRSNAVTSIKKYLKSNEFSSKIEKIITGFAEKYSNFTLKGILNTFGVRPDSLFDNFVNVKHILQRDTNHKLLVEAGINILKSIEINNIYQKIPEKSFESLKFNLVENINFILNKHIPSVLTAIDLPVIVENKINGLDLYEVENLLFSFMRDQFKWINILGFVLGFIFGAIQSLLFYFMN
jgi:uncharacterized membrane protein YheB (UPF0754 family)